MSKKTLSSTRRTIALLLMGASSLAGCDAEDQGFEEDHDAWSEEGFDEDSEGELQALDPALLDAIAAAPEILDEEVEDLFSSGEPTLRDVIRLVDLEMLPPDLTVEDLDRPIALDLTGPPGQDAAVAPAGDFASDIGPQFSGEPACATASISDPSDGATVFMNPAFGCVDIYDGATSPNTSYGPAGCPNQFVTEVRGTSGRELTFYSEWHGAYLTEAYCGLSSMGQTAYGGQWQVGSFLGTQIFYLSWTNLGDTRQHGEWIDNGFWLPHCSWQYGNGEGPIPALGSSHNYDRIRTATQGTVWGFRQRVEGGIRHGLGPC